MLASNGFELLGWGGGVPNGFTGDDVPLERDLVGAGIVRRSRSTRFEFVPRNLSSTLSGCGICRENSEI